MTHTKNCATNVVQRTIMLCKYHGEMQINSNIFIHYQRIICSFLYLCRRVHLLRRDVKIRATSRYFVCAFPGDLSNCGYVFSGKIHSP